MKSHRNYIVSDILNVGAKFLNHVLFFYNFLMKITSIINKTAYVRDSGAEHLLRPAAKAGVSGLSPTLIGLTTSLVSVILTLYLKSVLKELFHNAVT